jgi:hypothetical protein
LSAVGRNSEAYCAVAPVAAINSAQCAGAYCALQVSGYAALAERSRSAVSSSARISAAARGGLKW